MKTEQEQIDRIAKIICETYGTNYCKEFCGIATCSDPVVAQDIYNQGYRKATEVIDELVDKVLEKIKYEYENYPNAMTVGTYHQLRKEINELAAEMRQGVEK